MGDRKPFSLRIFVVDGDPDGLRLVERSNWNGKAIIFPRALYTQVRSRNEFNQTGVYLLLGPMPQSDGELLYVGEADPIRPRLDDHFARKDFWTRAVFFVAAGEKLNKAYVQYLEAQLVRRANAAKRVPLENANKPSEPTLSEADRADMDVFLDNILEVLPVLGIHAFEQSPHAPKESGTSILTCHGRGAIARGYDTPQGFVVQTRSSATIDEVPSLKEYFPYVSKLRTELRERGVLAPEGEVLRFTQDYTFNSPSLASSVIKGSSSNGRVDWKDASGRTLKELQEAQAAT
jgi:hypothetical protein